MDQMSRKNSADLQENDTERKAMERRRIRSTAGAATGHRSDWIGLNDIASVLNHEFNLDPPIAHTTPYDWWRRHKKNEMRVRLPKLVGMFGKSPAWTRGDIIDWYAQWKQLVPDYAERKAVGE